MTSSKTALVLGATGGIGGAIADALVQNGWIVRGMARDAQAAQRRAPHIDWIRGDAMNAADVVASAAGVGVIVHAVNPPNYANWDTLVLPMIDNTIAAARAVGARIVLPGTIYNFDPARTPVIGAQSPQQPHSRKGAIRVELERRLEVTSVDVPVLILRAGDFFGPGARSSWFSQAMVTPHRPVRSITNMARSGGHSWAYLPDLTETMVRLLDRKDRLDRFERVQFEGFYDVSGTGLIEAIKRIVGGPVSVRSFPWWAMALAAPFGGFPREAAEIAPYWRHPVRLDNTRLVDLIGPEPRTPLDEAVRAALAALGSAPSPQPNSAAIAA